MNTAMYLTQLNIFLDWIFIFICLVWLIENNTIKPVFEINGPSVISINIILLHFFNKKWKRDAKRLYRHSKYLFKQNYNYGAEDLYFFNPFYVNSVNNNNPFLIINLNHQIFLHYQILTLQKPQG